MLKQFSDIKHVVYINLESRTDRKEHVVAELSKLKENGLLSATPFSDDTLERQRKSIGIGDEAGALVRFNAVKLATGNGALGCSMSHLKCLEMAKKNDWPHVLICEDDIVFLDPVLLVSQINAFLSKNDSWDVLLLAGNNMLPYNPVDDTCIQVRHCLTTTGYIVQNHYFDTLIKNYKEGIVKLMKHPDDKKLYALDKYWIHLQMEDKWFLIIPLSVIQREDYSDIEGKVTNFKKYMLDYNKCYK
jgi:GR25 family glycosyltransferase involved in LPS biosynthesis